MTNRITYMLRGAATALALCAVATVSAQHSDVFPSTPNPVTPQSVHICGEKIDLDRLDMWERYDRELTSMVYTHGNTLLTIKRANKYFPVMAPILKKHGVPQDMLYLACIESYLNPTARSSAGAAGIWQFMPSTAKQYGLEVNDYVDERYNIVKATTAACRYLKRSYNKFGNWSAVMAAYNGGDARISKELESQQVNRFFDLHLVEETLRYPFRVMAMKAIMENPRSFGFILKDDQLYRMPKLKPVTVNSPVDDWAQWAKDNGTTYAQLRRDNPWIRAKSLPNKSKKTYTVLIPADSRSLSRKHIGTDTYSEKWTID